MSSPPTPSSAWDAASFPNAIQAKSRNFACACSPAAPIASIETRLRFKRLSGREIENYLGSLEWRGKAGGYAIQGIAGAFVVKLVGSYTGVVGLPLLETMALLDGLGYPAHIFWSGQA